jgi:hypothetical protein
MTAAKKLRELAGVIDSAVIMGTKENKAILKASGLYFADFDLSSDTDMLIAIKAKNEKIADDAIGRVKGIIDNLKKGGGDSREFKPRSIQKAVTDFPDANLALISVAGKYAGAEAMKALKLGLHVMLFSDNVSLETEIEFEEIRFGKRAFGDGAGLRHGYYKRRSSGVCQCRAQRKNRDSGGVRNGTSGDQLPDCQCR